MLLPVGVGACLVSLPFGQTPSIVPVIPRWKVHTNSVVPSGTVKVAVATAPAWIVPASPVAGREATLPTGSELLLHAASATPSAVTVMAARSAHRASLAAGAPLVWRGVVPACCVTIGPSWVVLVPA